MEKDIIDSGVSTGGEVISDQPKYDKVPGYGVGAKVETNSAGANIVSYPDDAPRSKTDVGDLLFAKDGYDPESWAANYDRYNSEATFDKEAFSLKAKERGFNDEQIAQYTEELDRFKTSYEDFHKMGNYFNKNMEGAYVSKRHYADNTLDFGTSKMQWTTDDHLAEFTGVWTDASGNIKSLADTDRGIMSIRQGNNGDYYLQEAADEEILDPNSVYTFMGARDLESSWYGSVGRGAMSATVGFGAMATGFSAGLMYKTDLLFSDHEKEINAYAAEYGISPEEARTIIMTKDQEQSDVAKFAIKMLNTGSYLTHQNIDEQGSILDEDFDANRLIYGLTDAAIQILPTILTGGAVSAVGAGIKMGIKGAVKGLSKKAIKGAVGNFIRKNSFTDFAAMTASQFYGSATVGGMQLRHMLNSGMSMDEAAGPAMGYAGLTFASENILSWNIVNRYGSRALTSRLGGMSAEALESAIDVESKGILKKMGVETIAELGKTGKKQYAKRLLAATHNIKYGQFAKDLFKGSKTVGLGAIEESVEEVAEGVMHGYLGEYLNGTQHLYAKQVQSDHSKSKMNKQYDSEGNFTGLYVYTDRHGQESTIDYATYSRYQKSLTKAEEILAGQHLYDEEMNIEEAIMAFGGTLISLGALHGTGIIKSDQEVHKSSAALAVEYSSDKKAFENYKEKLSSLTANMSAEQQSIAKRFDESVDMYMEIIKKYGIDSPTTQSALKSSASLTAEVANKYKQLDDRMQLLEAAKNDDFDWEKEGQGFRNKEEVQKSIENLNIIIDDYVKPKEGLTDAKGNPIEATTSLEYTRMFNYLSSWEEGVDQLSLILAHEKALGLSVDILDGETESPYDKAFNAELAKRKKEFREDLDLEKGTIGQEDFGRIQAIHSVLQKGLEQFENARTRDRENKDLSLKENTFSKTTTTIAARAEHFYNKFVEEFTENNKINDSIDEKMISSTEGILSKALTSLKTNRAAVEDGTFNYDESDPLSVGEKAISHLKDIVLPSLKATINTAMNDEVKKRVEGLEAAANAILEEAKGIDALRGVSDNFSIEDSAFTEALGGSAKAPELTSKQMMEARAKSLISAINQLRTSDNQAVSGFMDWINELLSNDTQIAEDEGRNIVENGEEILGALDLLDAFLVAEKHSRTLEERNEGLDKEHSLLAQNPQYRLSQAEIGSVKFFIFETRNSLKEILHKAYNIVGQKEDRLIEAQIMQIANQHYALNEVMVRGHFRNEKKKDALAKIEVLHSKIIEKAKKLGKERDVDNEPDNFDNIWRIYKSFNANEAEAKLAFVQEIIWEIEKNDADRIEIYSGEVDHALDALKKIYAEANANINFATMTALDSGEVIDHADKLLGGEFSPKKFKIGLSKLYASGNNLKDSASDASKSLWFYYTFLNRINNYGRNNAPTYKTLLHKYQKVVKQRFDASLKGEELASNNLEGKEILMFHASSHAQVMATMQVLGFLTESNNLGKKGNENTGKFGENADRLMYNAINILGYAGAGKTTQILQDVLNVWINLDGEKSALTKRILFVSPSSTLSKDFKKSIESLGLEDGQLDMININDFAAKDIDGYDLVIHDEASLINQSERMVYIEKIRAFKNKVIFLSDDDQVSDMENITGDNFTAGKMERTVPVVEVFRTGIAQFITAVDQIRERKAKGYAYYNRVMTYHINPETNERKGGKYVIDNNAVYEAFINRLNELDYKSKIVTTEDVILIVLDDKAYANLPASIDESMKRFVKIATRSQADDSMVSGIKADEVYVAINFDDNENAFVNPSDGKYMRTKIDNEAKAKVALTSISRARKFLMMVAMKPQALPESTEEIGPDVLREGQEVTVPVAEPRHASAEEQSGLNANNLAVQSSWIDTIAGKEKEIEDVIPPIKGDSPGRDSKVVYTKAEQAIFEKAMADAGLKEAGKGELKDVGRTITSIKEVESMYDEAIAQSTNDKRGIAMNRAKARMFRAAMQVNLMEMQKTGEDITDQLMETQAGQRLAQAISDFIIIAHNVKKPSRKMMKSIYSQMRYINIPFDVASGNLANLIVSPVVANGGLADLPFAIEFVGYQTNKDGTTTPIITLHEVKKTHNGEITPLDKKVLGAKVALLASKGFKINQIKRYDFEEDTYKDSFGIRPVKTHVIEYTELMDGIQIANKILKEKGLNEFSPDAIITEEELYAKEREVGSVFGVSVDDNITIGDSKARVSSVTAIFNGKDGYDYYIKYAGKGDAIKVNSQEDVNKSIVRWTPESQDKFKENALRFNKGKSEITSSQYLPLGEGVEYSQEDIYDEKSPSMKIRLDIRDYLSKMKAESLEVQFLSSIMVAKQGEVGYNLANAMAIVMPDHLIEAYLKARIVLNPSTDDNYTLEDFKKANYHIVTFANPIDIGFKITDNEGRKMSQVLFADSSGIQTEAYANIKEKAVAVLEGGGSFSLESMRQESSQEISDIFDDGKVFKGIDEGSLDKYASELLELNINRLYRMVVADIANSNPSLSVPMMSVIIDGTTNQLRLAPSDSPRPVQDFMKEAEKLGVEFSEELVFIANKDGIENEYVKTFSGAKGDGMMFVKGAIVNQEDFDATFLPSAEKVREDIAKESIRIKALKTEKGRKQARLKALKTIVEDSYVMNFIRASKSLLIDKTGEFKYGLSQYLTVKTPQHSVSGKIYVNGNMTNEATNLSHVIKILRELSLKKKMYHPVTKSLENTVTFAEGFNQPSLNLAYEIIVDDEIVEDDTSDFLMEVATKEGALESTVAEAQQEIDRLLGRNGLDNLEFRLNIDPVDIDVLIKVGDVTFEDEITDIKC